MFLTVKLILKVQDFALEEVLLAYERSMKHEIYRIAGAYKKNGAVFDMRYKYISDEVSWSSKEIVLQQAKALYERGKQGQEPKLPFSSIWHEQSYNIDERGFVLLKQGMAHHQELLKVPFYVHEQQLQRLTSGRRKEMVIKHQENQWLAYIQVEYDYRKLFESKAMNVDLNWNASLPAYANQEKS